MHRGHPLFDFEQRRKDQQRDSDLDMLLRSRDDRATRFAQQIKFFLARHGTQPKGDGRGAQAYDRLRDVLMGAMVPRNDGDGRRVLHELARLRAWLGQRGSAEECARDLIKDSLVHSRARGDWATYLMGIYPKAGKRASEDLTWCHGLRRPARVEQQGPWLEAVGKILAARTVVDDAEHSGDWQHKELSVLTALWRATEQTWIANDTQMTQIERLVRENAKP